MDEPEGDQAHAGRQADEDRREEEVELRHPEGELAEGGLQPLQREPPADDVGGAPPAAVRGAHAGLGQDQPGSQAGEGGTQDHEHVGGAPHGDVDAVGAVPHLVEREAGHGTQSESPEREQRAGDAQRSEAVPVDPVEGRHEGAEHRAAEDHDQPQQDAGVGCGQQLVISAECDVP